MGPEWRDDDVVDPDLFRDRTMVDPEKAKETVETEPFLSTFQEIDYQLYLADETTRMELGRETYGYLASLPFLAPDLDFDHLVVQVADPLADLAERVPDSHFTHIQEHLEDDADTCRVTCGDDEFIQFVFDDPHDESLAFRTQHSNIEFALPTHEAYMAYSEAHGMVPDDE